MSTSSDIIRVALLQLCPKPLDQEYNFEKAAAFIEQAASQKAQLAVLPEYYLTGWVPDEPGFAALGLQWPMYLKRYQDLARIYKICIVPGSMLHETKFTTEEGIEETSLQNVAYFIDHNGKILGDYRKKNLWHPERGHLMSSRHESHTPIETPFGLVGLLICWDLAFPEAFRELIDQGARIIIIPTFWKTNDASDKGLAINPNSEALFVTSTLTSRAFENTCCVIFVNAGGAKSENYMGLSRAVVPFLGPVNQTTDVSSVGGGPEEGMEIVDIDMSILEEAENTYKVREDLARDDWHYSYRHKSAAPT